MLPVCIHVKFQLPLTSPATQMSLLTCLLYTKEVHMGVEKLHIRLKPEMAFVILFLRKLGFFLGEWFK